MNNDILILTEKINQLSLDLEIVKQRLDNLNFYQMPEFFSWDEKGEITC